LCDLVNLCSILTNQNLLPTGMEDPFNLFSSIDTTWITNFITFSTMDRILKFKGDQLIKLCVYVCNIRETSSVTSTCLRGRLLPIVSSTYVTTAHFAHHCSFLPNHSVVYLPVSPPLPFSIIYFCYFQNKNHFMNNILWLIGHAVA
jgi:hypothetical protein